MSKFSPDDNPNSSSSQPAEFIESRFSPEAKSSPDRTVVSAPDRTKTRPNTPKTASDSAYVSGASPSSVPNQPDLDTVYAQTYPQYPSAPSLIQNLNNPPTPPTPPVFPGQATPPIHPTQPIPPTYPGQPIPPSFPEQTIPAGFPGQIPQSFTDSPIAGTPGSSPVNNQKASQKNKSHRKAIVALSILLVIALCALGITVYKVFTGEGSLASGVKPAWEKPATVELENEGEPKTAYTIYWPEIDKLALLQPFKDGNGIGQLLDPKTGTKYESPITLPNCPSSLKHPFGIVNGRIDCASTDIIKENKNQKYQFKEQIYTDKHLVVGASPTASNARQISAYNPKTSKLLWVENLKEPASVTCNGEKIYTTTPIVNNKNNTDNSAVKNKKSTLEVMSFTGSSQTQESPEKPLEGSNTKPPEQTKPEIAKDAIKNIDFANAYLPLRNNECFDEKIWQTADRTPIVNKMPDKTSHCWATMKNGASVEKSDPWDIGEMSSDVKLTPIKDIGEQFDSQSGFVTDSNNPYGIGYADVNEDGYLDAIVTTYDGEAVDFVLTIFDPDDPKHPYMAIIGGTQQGARLQLTPPGKITVFEPNPSSGKMDLVQAEMSIKGHEITDFSSIR